MVTEVKSGLSLLPWLSSLLQASCQRRAWFVARADTGSQSRSLMAVGTAHKRWWRPCSTHTVAAVGRLRLLGGAAVPPWHPQDMFQTPHSIHGLEMLLCHLSGYCSQFHLPVGLSTGQNSSLTLVRWGLQLFLALACAICPFPEHPCRICALAS